MTETFQACPEPDCTLVVREITIKPTGLGDHTYTFHVWLERPAGRAQLLQTITYTSSELIALKSGAGTPALTSVVLPAMAMGVDVRIEAPVSNMFLTSLDTIQDIFHGWFPQFSRVEISTDGTIEPKKPSAKVTGAFFSSGVDGFCSLKRNMDDISKLVFVHGYDVDLDRVGHRVMVEKQISTIADDMNRDLIVMQTNVRSFSDKYAWWGHYGGWTLGTCSQLLEGSINQMLIASSSNYNQYSPFTTNPLTDPMFSTECMDILHTDNDVSRLDKIHELSHWDYAMKRLRVCWRMEDSVMNCCECSKCLRTMSMLWLDDLLDRCPTFNRSLDPAKIAALQMREGQLCYALEIVDRAKELGKENHEIIKSWKTAIERSRSMGGPTTEGDLAAAINSDLFRDVWLARHAPAMMRDAGRYHPAALHASLLQHAPNVVNGMMRKFFFHQPAAFVGRVLRNAQSRKTG